MCMHCTSSRRRGLLALPKRQIYPRCFAPAWTFLGALSLLKTRRNIINDASAVIRAAVGLLAVTQPAASWATCNNTQRSSCCQLPPMWLDFEWVAQHSSVPVPVSLCGDLAFRTHPDTRFLNANTMLQSAWLRSPLAIEVELGVFHL